jgi:nitrogen regulatory protein P-II 1
MKKIEAYIRPEKLEAIKAILSGLRLNGLSITQVMGCGNQQGWKKFVRGTEVDYNFLQKIKLELVVCDEQLEPAVQGIIDVSRTGEFGDGKIFVYEVAEAVRIRTGERGEAAIKCATPAAD